MDIVVFGAMLASAFLHAVWNAWVKSRRDSNAAIAALVIGAGIPNIAVIAGLGWPAAPAWPWIACTVTLSIAALTLLGAAYREGDFAVAFPQFRFDQREPERTVDVRLRFAADELGPAPQTVVAESEAQCSGMRLQLADVVV